MIGKTVSNYRIIEKLGEGGMGVVYKAHQLSLDRDVALKILSRSLCSDPAFIKRFKREARAVARLHHQNIIQIHDISEDKDFHFFSMEYIGGRTLDKVLEEKEILPLDTAIDIVTQVAQALKHAHNNKITHRDIKPSNIILDSDGNVKVMDFGLAIIAGESSKLTEPGMLVGTIAYMSPEQCEGEALDHRTDIYSLGVVLYEMLAGVVPFRAESVPALVHKVVYEEPPDVRSINPDVPPGLSDVLTRAIAKNKEDRYPSIADFLEDIARFKNLALAKRIPPRRLRSTRRMTMPGTEGLAEVGAGLDTVTAGPLMGTEMRAPSIAVLPFVNMSADPEQEYFCDGLSEELINALTQIEDLHVIARTSAFSFKNKDVDIHEIGQRLKAQTVLEGSVRKAGNRLRITAQLVETAHGHHLWSERYDRELNDIFVIQDEITSAIVEKLGPKLFSREKPRANRNQPVNLEAYRLYLKGRWFWDKLTEKSLMKAIELFGSATEKDPRYAPAYAGLADSYCTLPLTSSLPPKEVYPKAKEAALKAIEIDATLAEAHASLAHILFRYDWDWQAAEKEYRKAIELNPGSAAAHYWFSSFLKYMGRFEESLQEITRSLELDPLSLQKNADAALAYCYAAQSDQAVDTAQRTIEMDPSYSYAHAVLGYIYLRGFMIEESLAEFEKCRSLSKNDFMAERGIAGISALKGKTDEARHILNSFIRQAEEQYYSSYYIAALHFILGDIDEGFSWLERAYEERDYFLINLKTETTLRTLGLDSDPRYISLLSKMNFPV